MPDHLSNNTHKKKKKNNPVSKDKAKKILRDGSVRGKKLTSKQKGFFGARVGGSKHAKQVKRIFS